MKKDAKEFAILILSMWAILYTSTQLVLWYYNTKNI